MITVFNKDPIKVVHPLHNKVKKFKDKNESHGPKINLKSFKKSSVLMQSLTILDSKNWHKNLKEVQHQFHQKFKR